MNKVLIIANCASGLYDFREDLIRRLGTLNQKVYTSVPVDEYVEELTSLGCKIIDTPVDRRGVNPVKDIKLLLRYFKIINQVKPDLVITYTIKPNVYAGLICRLKKIPYAVNITGLGTTFQNDGILKKLVTAMYKVSSKNAKVVFFENIENSEQMRINGMPLNKTYTGKAFWGMTEYIKKNDIKHKNILFINTGGAPLFFDDLGNLE